MFLSIYSITNLTMKMFCFLCFCSVEVHCIRNCCNIIFESRSLISWHLALKECFRYTVWYTSHLTVETLQMSQFLLKALWHNVSNQVNRKQNEFTIIYFNVTIMGKSIIGRDNNKNCHYLWKELLNYCRCIIYFCDCFYLWYGEVSWWFGDKILLQLKVKTVNKMVVHLLDG